MKVIKVFWRFADIENSDTYDDIVFLNNNEVTEENIKRKVESDENDDYCINIVSWKIIANSYQDYIEGKN